MTPCTPGGRATPAALASDDAALVIVGGVVGKDHPLAVTGGFVHDGLPEGVAVAAAPAGAVGLGDKSLRGGSDDLSNVVD